MKLRKLLVSCMMVIVLSAANVFAVQKNDFAKPEGDPMDWQMKAKFSTLHRASGTGSDLSDQDVAARWPGFGSLQEARRILRDALYRVDGIYSVYSQAQFLEEACRDARNSCGNADKYRALILAMVRAYRTVNNLGDRVKSLKAGIEYLVNGGGDSMTKSFLTLGLSMTRPAFYSHYDAYNVMKSIFKNAGKAAESENPQWNSMLLWGYEASDALNHSQSKYLLLERIARNIVEAQQGTTIFTSVLYDISAMNLVNSWDHYNVLVMGLKRYSKDVPSRTHKEVARYIGQSAEQVTNKTDAVQMLRKLLAKFRDLPFDSPAAKVLCGVALDISEMPLSDYTKAPIVVDGIERALRLDLPAHIASSLRRTLSDAEYTYDSRRKIRILQSGLHSVLD